MLANLYKVTIFEADSARAAGKCKVHLDRGW